MARSMITKSLWTAAGVAGGLVLLTAAGAGFVMARVALTVITPVRKRPQNQSIRAVDRDAGTVTLKDTPDAAVPGRYGLWFDDDAGYAKVGGLAEREAGEVGRT